MTRRSTRAATAILLACAALFGVGVRDASASLSPFVNTTWQNFGGAAADCTAYVGAYYRADKMVQGAAELPCNLRHAQTVGYVRLVRYYQGLTTYYGWKGYTFTNSYGTGNKDLVTDPIRPCGNASWYTEVYATVYTGSTYWTVDFTNNWQTYNPCA